MPERPQKLLRTQLLTPPVPSLAATAGGPSGCSARLQARYCTMHNRLMWQAGDVRLGCILGDCSGESNSLVCIIHLNAAAQHAAALLHSVLWPFHM